MFSKSTLLLGLTILTFRITGADVAVPTEDDKDLVLDVYDNDKREVICGAFLLRFDRVATAQCCIGKRIIILIRDLPGYLIVEGAAIENSPGVVILKVTPEAGMTVSFVGFDVVNNNAFDQEKKVLYAVERTKLKEKEGVAHYPIFREVTISEKRDLFIRVAPVKELEYDTYDLPGDAIIFDNGVVGILTIQGSDRVGATFTKMQKLVVGQPAPLDCEEERPGVAGKDDGLAY